MQFEKLAADDRAVPPVIGVILMVAITVILAAVTATFVLGLGGDTSVAPTASFDFQYDAETSSVVVVHQGGDNIQQDRLYIRGENIGATGNWQTVPESEASGLLDGKSAVVSGDIANVTNAGSDYVIRVVWEAEDGDTSSELATARGPDA